MSDLPYIIVIVASAVVGLGTTIASWFWGRHLLKKGQREDEERQLRNQCPICQKDLGDYIPFHPASKMVWYPEDTYLVFKRVCKGCWHPNLQRELSEKTKQ